MPLQTKAKECKFSCFKCKAIDNDSRVFDRFITGIRDSRIQIDLFTNIDKLKTLRELLKQAEVYETAIKSHDILATSSNNYSQNDNVCNISNFNSNRNRGQHRSCWRCNRFHNPNNCPALKLACYHCGNKGHFERCCPEKAKSQEKNTGKGRNNYNQRNSRKQFNNSSRNRKRGCTG